MTIIYNVLFGAAGWSLVNNRFDELWWFFTQLKRVSDCEQPPSAECSAGKSDWRFRICRTFQAKAAYIECVDDNRVRRQPLHNILLVRDSYSAQPAILRVRLTLKSLQRDWFSASECDPLHANTIMLQIFCQFIVARKNGYNRDARGGAALSHRAGLQWGLSSHADFIGVQCRSSRPGGARFAKPRAAIARSHKAYKFVCVLAQARTRANFA